MVTVLTTSYVKQPVMLKPERTQKFLYLIQKEILLTLIGPDNPKFYKLKLYNFDFDFLFSIHWTTNNPLCGHCRSYNLLYYRFMHLIITYFITSNVLYIFTRDILFFLIVYAQ